MGRNFDAILKETQQAPERRIRHLRKIKKLRDGRAIVSFFISFKANIPLMQSDADMIEEVLSGTDTSKGLTLILDAPGGDGLAAERIVNICKSYSQNDFETIVPTRAKSAATMICLGSDRIIMSPTSELGPIDPQVPFDLGNGPEWVAAHTIIKTYDALFEKACAIGEGRIEPILQQLQLFNSVKVEQLRIASALSEDIAKASLANGMMNGISESTIRKNIKPFTDPEMTKSHGRGILRDQAKDCGLEIHNVEIKDELWQEIWALYLRSKYVVDNTQVRKLVETTDSSYMA